MQRTKKGQANTLQDAQIELQSLLLVLQVRDKCRNRLFDNGAKVRQADAVKT